MRRKNMTKGLTVLLLLAILAVAIVILVKVNRKKSNNGNKNNRMGDYPEAACDPIDPDNVNDACKAWAANGWRPNNPDGYCDYSDPNGGNCIGDKQDALNCCLCAKQPVPTGTPKCHG